MGKRNKYPKEWKQYKKVGGIYKIENLLNGKVYIGSSSNIYNRWIYHFRTLKDNKHYNYHLQQAFNKYGEHNFNFSVIEIIKNEFDDLNKYKKELISRETFYIKKYESFNKDKGYNLTKTAEEVYDGSLTIEDLKNGKGAVTYEQYDKIINLLVNTELTFLEIAEEVGIDKGTISSIYYRQRYVNLTNNIVFKSRSKYKKEEFLYDNIEELKKMLQEGKWKSEIAEKFGVPEWTVEKVAKDINLYNYKIKKVYCYKINGIYIGEFESPKDASEKLNIPVSSIKNQLRGDRKTVNHLYWFSYEKEFKKLDYGLEELFECIIHNYDTFMGVFRYNKIDKHYYLYPNIETALKTMKKRKGEPTYIIEHKINKGLKDKDGSYWKRCRDLTEEDIKWLYHLKYETKYLIIYNLLGEKIQ